jgi:hypothetical protein
MFGIPLFVVGLCVVLLYVFYGLPLLTNRGVIKSERVAKWSTRSLVVLWAIGTIIDFVR